MKYQVQGQFCKNCSKPAKWNKKKAKQKSFIPSTLSTFLQDRVTQLW